MLRNVCRHTHLVEEDIFAIASFRRKVLQVSISTNAMLLTKLLPELTAHYRKRLSVILPSRKSLRLCLSQSREGRGDENEIVHTVVAALYQCVSKTIAD